MLVTNFSFKTAVVLLGLFGLLIIGVGIFSLPVVAQSAQIDDEPVIVDTTADQTEQESVSEPVAEPTASLPESFDYVAEECNNLTLLVRKSLQIYDAQTEDVELTSAQIIYAETNVTQKMGSFMLDIGDEVSVPRELVDEFATSSQDLSPGTLAAWDSYTPTVDFELDDIAPVNVSITEDNTIVESETLTDQSPLTELGEAESDDNASPVWWFVGIGSVLLLWYVLWRRQEEDIS
ncbi:MAG: hypothetical protein R3313_04100 [Candidatus Saccharimonadales bacterium]|nr:hypothetical protein [Candidatus Saccharimonadales bacterium]